MPEWTIRLIETVEGMAAFDELQCIVWPGSEREVVHAPVLVAIVHNGGLLLGAYVNEQLVGAAFGFPGFYVTPDGPRLKHHSHILAVHPQWRNSGIGFALKRAQWQMVRCQGLDLVTWTYDPLLSRNAHLNITRLGVVCNTYRRSEYGEMQDSMNIGLPSDRFLVDWWLNTPRVERRLSRIRRPALDLDHFLAADVSLCAAVPGSSGWLRPPEDAPTLGGRLLLVEIPPDFLALKEADLALARDWRFYAREAFETAFAAGYLVTDFVFEQNTGASSRDPDGGNQRSFYVLTHGESTLDDPG
jgi:predicted GNAT superfamily acetyltransferase